MADDGGGDGGRAKKQPNVIISESMNAVFSILLNYAEHPVLLAVLPSARHPEGLKHLPWNANVGLLLEILLLFSPPCMPYIYMHRCARP